MFRECNRGRCSSDEAVEEMYNMQTWSAAVQDGTTRDWEWTESGEIDEADVADLEHQLEVAAEDEQISD